jgi:hypothetical protein
MLAIVKARETQAKKKWNFLITEKQAETNL